MRSNYGPLKPVSPYNMHENGKGGRGTVIIRFNAVINQSEPGRRRKTHCHPFPTKWHDARNDDSTRLRNDDLWSQFRDETLRQLPFSGHKRNWQANEACHMFVTRTRFLFRHLRRFRLRFFFFSARCYLCRSGKRKVFFFSFLLFYLNVITSARECNQPTHASLEIRNGEERNGQIA